MVDIESECNRVIVGTEPETHSFSAYASDAVFGASEDFDPAAVYGVKIRSMADPVPAHAERAGDGFRVSFLSYVKGLAPGQSAVVYDGDAVVASGIISGK